MAGDETVGDQEADRLGDIVGRADAADRRLAAIFGEGGRALLGG